MKRTALLFALALLLVAAARAQDEGELREISSSAPTADRRRRRR